MDRVFQWLWDRYGPRYSWAICVLIYLLGLFVFGSYSLIIVAFEGSGGFIDAAVVTAVAVLVQAYLLVLPARRRCTCLKGGQRATRSIR